MTAKAEVERRGRPSKGLELELERLKRTLNLAHELRVEWHPGRVRHSSGRQLSGEVLGETIYVYEESEPKALMVLRHEFVEYVLTSEFTVPYKRMINTLISAFEKEAYQRKERVVKRISEILRE